MRATHGGADGDMATLRIPIPQDGISWTPQGLAHAVGQDLLVHTMYDHDDPERGLLVLQPADGSPVQYLRIEGNRHYGGVAVDGDNVYVCGNGGPGENASHVQLYSLTDLRRPGAAAPRPQRMPVATGSTLATHDGSLYVARFSRNAPGQGPPMVYEYVLDPGGSLPQGEGAALPVDAFAAPEGVQGVTTMDGENFFFTQSHGHGRHSSLTRVHRRDPDHPHLVRGDLSALSQGIDVRRGQFIITGESSSRAHRAKVKATDSPFVPNVIERPVRPDGALQVYDVPD